VLLGLKCAQFACFCGLGLSSVAIEKTSNDDEDVHDTMNQTKMKTKLNVEEREETEDEQDIVRNGYDVMQVMTMSIV